MKKKIITVVLAAALAVSMAACANSGNDEGKLEKKKPTESSASEKPSSDDPSSKKPSSEEPSNEEPSSEDPSSEETSSEEPSSEEPSSKAPTVGDDKLLQTKFLDIVDSGTYYIDMTAQSSGTSMSMGMAKDGDKVYLDLGEMGAMLGYSKLISNGQKMYILVDADKTAYESPVEEDVLEQFESIFTKTFEDSGLTYVSTGTGKFNGKNYTYEEYSMSDVVPGEGVSVVEGASQTTVKYFFDDNVIVGNESTNGNIKSTTLIDLKTTVDQSIFEVPAGYTVKDIDDFEMPSIS